MLNDSLVLPSTHLKPASTLSRVDFPAPEGPRMAMSRPDLKAPQLSLRIWLLLFWAGVLRL